VGYFEQATSYVETYANINRLRHGVRILDVLSSFYLFSIAAPVPALPLRLTSGAATGYLDGPTAIVGFAGITLLLGYVIVGLFGRFWRITVPLVVWNRGARGVLHVLLPNCRDSVLGTGASCAYSDGLIRRGYHRQKQQGHKGDACRLGSSASRPQCAGGFVWALRLRIPVRSIWDRE
jgi:hypothetical protein